MTEIFSKMKKKLNLTAAQLEEIKELAKPVVCYAPGKLGTAIKLRKITLLNALLIYMFFLS